MMEQPWVAERMTEDHRRQLEGLRRHADVSEGRGVEASTSVMAGGPNRVEREIDRYPAVRGQLGSWLIRAGTRLGGATVSTS
jgi:hypothetical protein